MGGRGAVRTPYEHALALGSWAWKNRRLIFGRIALAGGDPEQTSLPTFLNAAYALIVDDYQYQGTGRTPLAGAIQETDDLINRAAYGPLAANVPPTVAANGKDVAPTAAENDRALAELKAMIGNVG